MLSIYTKNKINLSDYNYVYLKFSGGIDKGYGFFSCNKTESNNIDDFDYYFKRIITTDENIASDGLSLIKIDISSIHDSCYIGVAIGGTYQTTHTSTWFGINEIYFE